MKLKAVGRISMSYLRFEVGGQVDNVDSAKWAFLWANATSYAEGFRDKCDLRLGGDFDTEAATPDNRARLLTLLATFLRLALVTVDDRDTGEFIGHLGVLGTEPFLAECSVVL